MEAEGKTLSGESGISSLSDSELLANTRALIGRSNQVLAALLAHLGEVEARGLHRTRACSSLYAYSIYELRLSEDAASQALRLTRSRSRSARRAYSKKTPASPARPGFSHECRARPRAPNPKTVPRVGGAPRAAAS
jgi:hypothetical protein